MQHLCQFELRTNAQQCSKDRASMRHVQRLISYKVNLDIVIKCFCKEGVFSLAVKIEDFF